MWRIWRRFVRRMQNYRIGLAGFLQNRLWGTTPQACNESSGKLVSNSPCQCSKLIKRDLLPFLSTHKLVSLSVGTPIYSGGIESRAKSLHGVDTLGFARIGVCFSGLSFGADFKPGQQRHKTGRIPTEDFRLAPSCFRNRTAGPPRKVRDQKTKSSLRGFLNAYRAAVHRRKSMSL